MGREQLEEPSEAGVGVQGPAQIRDRARDVGGEVGPTADGNLMRRTFRALSDDVGPTSGRSGARNQRCARSAPRPESGPSSPPPGQAAGRRSSRGAARRGHRWQVPYARPGNRSRPAGSDAPSSCGCGSPDGRVRAARPPALRAIVESSRRRASAAAGASVACRYASRNSDWKNASSRVSVEVSNARVKGSAPSARSPAPSRCSLAIRLTASRYRRAGSSPGTVSQSCSVWSPRSSSARMPRSPRLSDDRRHRYRQPLEQRADCDLWECVGGKRFGDGRRGRWTGRCAG